MSDQVKLEMAHILSHSFYLLTFDDNELITAKRVGHGALLDLPEARCDRFNGKPDA